jgi:paraquat-inducible protein A
MAPDLPHPRSLAARATGADRLLGPGFALAGLMLIAGWSLPIMTISKLVFFAERLSILDAIAVLWREDQIFLSTVVAIFSIVFPALKIGAALWLWYAVDAENHGLHRALDRLEALSRWSMLDVFLAALTIVAIQVSLIGEVTTHLGLYVFTAAVVLSMLGVRRLIVLARRDAHNDRSDSRNSAPPPA